MAPHWFSSYLLFFNLSLSFWNRRKSQNLPNMKMSDQIIDFQEMRRWDFLCAVRAVGCGPCDNISINSSYYLVWPGEISLIRTWWLVRVSSLHFSWNEIFTSGIYPNRSTRAHNLQQQTNKNDSQQRMNALHNNFHFFRTPLTRSVCNSKSADTTICKVLSNKSGFSLSMEGFNLGQNFLNSSIPF